MCLVAQGSMSASHAAAGEVIGTSHGCYDLNCPHSLVPQIHTLRSRSSVPYNVTMFGKRTIVEVRSELGLCGRSEKLVSARTGYRCVQKTTVGGHREKMLYTRQEYLPQEAPSLQGLDLGCPVSTCETHNFC